MQDKQTRYEKLRRRCRAAARQIEADPGFRVYSYPLDRDLLSLQRAMLDRSLSLYPEDLANLELVRAALGHPLVKTEDPAKADLFFVPIFMTGFAITGRRKLMEPLVRSLYHLTGKANHLVFSSDDANVRPLPARANPFCPLRYHFQARASRGTGERLEDLGHSWLDDRFFLMTFESTADLEPLDIPLCPTVDGPLRSPFAGDRDLLYSFVGTVTHGGVSPGHVRGREKQPIWSALGQGSDCFIGTEPEARTTFHTDAALRVGYQRSLFTLCPAGKGRWSFRLTEAIVNGSIPVLLSDGYLKPYASELDWDRFSITVPEAELAGVGDRLRALPRTRILELQRGLAEAQRSFTAAGLTTRLLSALGRATRQARQRRGAFSCDGTKESSLYPG